MKRYDPSLSEFPEQARLQLQHVVPEAPRGRRSHSEQSPTAAKRLFAIRGALLDEERDGCKRPPSLRRN